MIAGMNDNDACCACLAVKYDPVVGKDLTTERWRCPNCGGEFQRVRPKTVAVDWEKLREALEKEADEYYYADGACMWPGCEFWEHGPHSDCCPLEEKE